MIISRYTSGKMLTCNKGFNIQEHCDIELGSVFAKLILDRRLKYSVNLFGESSDDYKCFGC